MGAFCGSLAWAGVPENLTTIAAAHSSFGRLAYFSGNRYRFARCEASFDLRPVATFEHRGNIVIGQFDDRKDAARLQRWLEGEAGSFAEALPSLESDFAVASFNDREDSLLLARAPLSSIPLAYRHSGASTVFATLASSLHQGGNLDLDFVLRSYGTEPVFGSRQTAFKDVQFIEPGTVIRFTRRGATVHRFWSADQHDALCDRDASDLLRQSLDDAIGRDIRDYAGSVASHLSGGRDSGLVTATTASQLAANGRRLLALTASPDRTSGSDYEVREDEESAARSVAARHTNVDHEIIRVRSGDLGAMLDRYNRNRASPYGAPVNLPWWDRSLEVAAGRGCKLLLTGVAGNLTVSAGGPDAIVDLLRTGHYRQWLGAIFRAARFPRARYRSLLFHSLAPWLPVPAVRALRKIADRPAFSAESPFFGKQLRKQLAIKEQVRPFRNWRAMFQDALETNDDADPNSFLVHGMTLRDPLADRQVVEAMLKIRPGAFASPWDERTIFDKAFADRLPVTTLRPTVRGAQAADWHSAIDPSALMNSVQEYSRNPMVREFLDTNVMLEAIRAWPTNRVADPALNYLYPYRLLPAVSFASFLNCHYPR